MIPKPASVPLPFHPLTGRGGCTTRPGTRGARPFPPHERVPSCSTFRARLPACATASPAAASSRSAPSPSAPLRSRSPTSTAPRPPPAARRATRRSSTSSSAAARRTRTCGTSRPRRRAEIRGEFQPIATNVPGIQIGEVFPRIAAPHGQVRRHPLDRRQLRRPRRRAVPDRLAARVARAPGRPAQHRRRAVAALQGPVDPSVPPFVGLAAPTQHRPWSDPGQTGFLGPSHAPVQAGWAGPGQPAAATASAPPSSADRRRLIQSFDRLRRDVDVDRHDRTASTRPSSAPSAC